MRRVGKTKRVVKQAKAPSAKSAQAAKPTAQPAKAVPSKRASKPAVTKAVKPARPSKPSLPLPPPPPAPPPVRDELAAPRDIARLLRYGERFGDKKIDIRMLPLQLAVPSGVLAICDPAAPKSWRVLDRPAAPGTFRVMLAVARGPGGEEDLAAVVIHVGRPPIERWTVAHARGKKPRTFEDAPRWDVGSGWIAVVDGGGTPAGSDDGWQRGSIDAGSDGGAPGPLAVPASSGVTPIEVPLTDGRRALALPCGKGAYVAYWAIDATDKPVCLVLDFDVFTQKEWKPAKVTS